MKHYFVNDETLKNDRKEITFRFFGREFSFISDAGVFAKDKIDYGSRLLLETLAQTPLRGNFCDYGCGYGVIGIVLAKLYPINVFAVDVVTRALALTQENALRNQIKLTVSQALVGENTMQTIALNPPIRAGKNTIYSMFQTAYQALTPTGGLYVVMRKDQGALSAIKELQQYFPEVVVKAKSKGFWVFVAYK